MEIHEILSVSILSAVKFIPGFLLALGYDLNTFQTFLSVSLGGLMGVAIYSYFGNEIRNYFDARKRRKGKLRHPNKQKIKRLRLILGVWKKYGIYGIAFLTPPILSPPVGTLIALAFGEKAPRIVLFMGISCFFWGLAFAMFGDFLSGWLNLG